MHDGLIWGFLMSKIGNPYGVAGLMGNLYVESKLNSGLLQSASGRRLSMTSEEYTKVVDDGSYTNFIQDKAGYGLAQWTYWSRKEALLNYAKKAGCSIGDVSMQLSFLWDELQKYKTCLDVLKKATCVREASDAVVEHYEKPNDQSEKGKQNRADYGQKFYDKYVKTEGKRVRILADKTNIRNGNGKEYKRIAGANKDDVYPWIATAENGWHAIVCQKQVCWVSGEFSAIM